MKQVVNLFKALLWVAILLGATMAANAQTCTYNQVVSTEVANPTFPTLATDATIEFDSTVVLLYEYGKPNHIYNTISVWDSSYVEPVLISRYANKGGITWDTAYHYITAIVMKEDSSTLQKGIPEWHYIISDFINGSLCPNLLVFVDYNGYQEWMSLPDKSKALTQVCTNHPSLLYYTAYDTSEELKGKPKKKSKKTKQ
jgi:hypothetical protein